MVIPPWIKYGDPATVQVPETSPPGTSVSADGEEMLGGNREITRRDPNRMTVRRTEPSVGYGDEVGIVYVHVTVYVGGESGELAEVSAVGVNAIHP